MDKKKLILAQLCAGAINSLSKMDSWEDIIQDAIWMMSTGIGGAEDQAKEFERVFKETFGISFDSAPKLNLF